MGGKTRMLSLAAIVLFAGALVACTPSPPVGCYDSDTWVDLRFDGPPNTAGNATVFSSQDGSCTGASVAQTVVTGNLNAAYATCQGLGGVLSPVEMSTFWPTMPAGNYPCDAPIGVTFPAVGCHQGTGGVYDASYEGPPNAVDNVTAYFSADGTCQGVVVQGTLVTGSDAFDADTRCQNLGGTLGLEVNTAYPTIPLGTYACYM